MLVPFSFGLFMLQRHEFRTKIQVVSEKRKQADSREHSKCGNVHQTDSFSTDANER